MSQTPPDPGTPPAPGWWLASDGNWYPPQPPAPQRAPQQLTPQAPPPAPKSNKGCLIALGIFAVVLVLGIVLAAFVIYKVADTVKDVADGIQVGDVECPAAESVSDLVGSDVELAMSGSLVVASGCNYTSTDAAGGAGVTIVSGAGLIADEVLNELESEAQSNQTQTSGIDVGDNGRAFGSPMRSAAATKADGHIVQVDIFSSGSEPIGDHKAEAVQLLEDFIDLNY